MKIDFTGRHMDVTEAIRSHTISYFERIEQLFEGKKATAHIIIEVEKGTHRSEAVVKWRNEVLNATSKDADMYKSISLTIDKIEKQARRLKEKVVDKSHKAKKASKMPVLVASEKLEPEVGKIITEKRYSIKPMTAEEARLILKSDKDGYLLFRDADSGGISLLRKRADGNFGLIQT